MVLSAVSHDQAQGDPGRVPVHRRLPHFGLRKCGHLQAPRAGAVGHLALHGRWIPLGRGAAGNGSRSSPCCSAICEVHREDFGERKCFGALFCDMSDMLCYHINPYQPYRRPFPNKFQIGVP